MPKIIQQTAYYQGDIPPGFTPLTDLLTFRPELLIDNPGVPQWFFVWANYCRSNGDANPPLVDGKGFRFSSIAKANFATLAALRSAFFGSYAAKVLCGNQGLRYVEWGDTDALAGVATVGGHYRDVAYCPPLIKDKVKGFILDYEVADKRSGQVTATFLRRVAGEMHAIPRGIYTNQVSSAGYTNSGLSGNEAVTRGQFHGLTILQDHNERLLARQLAVLGVSPAKVFVTLDLATNTHESVLYARSFVQSKRLAGVNIWRNGADMTAPATAAKMQLFSHWVT